jgi:hypothetical protein
MPDGEVIFQNFKAIIQKPFEPITPLDLPNAYFSEFECCDELLVLADTSSADEFKNDCNSFIIMQSEYITSIVLTLQKKENGAWIDKTTITDQTFGNFFAYGFFENNLFEDALGFQPTWSTILSTYDEGCYRFKTDEATILATTINNFSPTYTLKQYTPQLADKSILIEWFNNSTIGVSERDPRKADFKGIGDIAGVDVRGWKNCLRLKGWFYYSESEYLQEATKYASGRLEEYRNEQTPIYKMKLLPVGSYIHNLLRTQILQSDDIYITDYNSTSPDIYKQKLVTLRSGYPPNWFINNTSKASVELEFNQKINNLEIRC